MKKVTIKDIARELGIAVSTVSRALSDQWDVSAKTRELVLQKAKEMNYEPNPMAVNLVTKRTKTIGLIVPEFENSFFPKIITYIQRILDEHRYQLLIMQSDESAEKERLNIQILEKNRVDGIILSITREGGNEEIYKRTINNGTPIVFFNRVSPNINAPKVVIDDYQMSYLATEHLIAEGYQKIGHLTGPANLILTSIRKQGFLDAMAAHNMPIYGELVVPAGVLQEKGMAAMQQLFDGRFLPDALFCFNDPVAIGAMLVIKKQGLKIPDDIALVGFSESRSALLVEPQLTTICQPFRLIGETAAELIMKLLNNKYIENYNITLHAQLNIRGSSERIKTDKKGA